MLGRLVHAAAALAMAAASPGALAQESVLDQPPDREAWPTEITRRPLTLAPGMVELTVPVDINANQGRFGKPVSLAPDLYYGASSALMVGVRHALGLCFGGADSGCRKTYDDVTLDTVWGVTRDVAVGLALTASPVSDPSLTLSGEARVIARLATGPVALTVVPTVSVGFNERDTPGVAKTVTVSFPLASYTYGFYQQTPGNKEYLSIPVSLTAQATPDIAISVGSALHGPLYNTSAGDFGDQYKIPLAGALVITPERHIDVGGSFTFQNLLGRNGSVDSKALQFFASYRI